MFYYAFTLRSLEGTQDYKKKISDMLGALTVMKQKYPDFDIRYHYEVVIKENGNHNVHIHGVFKCKKRPYFKKLHPGKNFHFWIEVLKNETAWTVYISKQKHDTKEDVIEYLDNWKPRSPKEAKADDEGLQSIPCPSPSKGYKRLV